MDVRDLITELLDHDMDAEVTITFDAERNQIDEDFDVDSLMVAGSEYVTLVHKSDDMEIVDKNDLRHMETEIDFFKDKVEELENEIKELEGELNE